MLIRIVNVLEYNEDGEEIVTESCCKVVGVYDDLLPADDMRSTYDNPNHYVIVPCW